MGATAYLVQKIIWQEDHHDLPAEAVVYLPNWFCLSEGDPEDDEWDEMIYERLASRFGYGATQMTFRPASIDEEKRLAGNV